MEEIREEQLENVVGGLTDQEIISNINELYSFVPLEIRTKIIDAINNYGRKAAHALAEKLLKGMDQAKGIVDLLK